MSSGLAAAAEATVRSATIPRVQPRVAWPVTRWWALAGVAFVAYQTPIWAGWLASHPHEVRTTRVHDHAFYAARAYEAVIVVVALPTLVWVVRGCRREGRLTFDAMACIAGAATFWIDPINNWLQPDFGYSSAWINLNQWSSHVPFVLNPHTGDGPEPMVFIGLSYLIGFPLFFALICRVLDAVRSRRPSIGRLGLFCVAFLLGVVIDVLFELPMFLLDLWAYPGSPAIGFFPHSSHRLPLIEIVVAGAVFAGLALLRFLRDDTGRTFVERGWATPGGRSVGGVLALVAVFNLAFLAAGVTEMLGGLYSSSYPDLPASVMNGMCGDGTAYGPCPGSPGYRVPLR